MNAAPERVSGHEPHLADATVPTARARRVVITGGLGFIGSYVAERFARDGWIVSVIDDRRGNVVSAISGVVVHTGRAEDREVLARIVHGHGEGRKADLVIHCASPVGPGAIAEADYGVTEAIVEPTIAVSRACAVASIPLIHISTSEVYGNSGVCSETDGCNVPPGNAPRLEYAVGKLASEKIALHADAAIVRPFNVTAARQDARKGFVVPNFVEAAIKGEPLRVFTPGTQRRAIQSVHDLVEGIVRIAETPEAFGEIFNIGNPANEISVTHLAELIVRLLDSDSEIEVVDGRTVWGPKWSEAAGFHKLPDIEKARALLGWEPTVPLPSLIRDLADEIRAQ